MQIEKNYTKAGPSNSSVSEPALVGGSLLTLKRAQIKKKEKKKKKEEKKKEGKWRNEFKSSQAQHKCP